jgi:hypothetical protein
MPRHLAIAVFAFIFLVTATAAGLASLAARPGIPSDKAGPSCRRLRGPMNCSAKSIVCRAKSIRAPMNWPRSSRVSWRNGSGNA